MKNPAILAGSFSGSFQISIQLIDNAALALYTKPRRRSRTLEAATVLNLQPKQCGGISVPQIPRQQDKQCFGAYEVHLPTQEIFKYGSRIKLPPQAFRVLQMLMGRPGQLVTREEFHRALWPADTFVDFDHGLNNAIKKIRNILSDSADAPRYIETLPKLGYRFIGQIDGASHAPTIEPKPAGEWNNVFVFPPKKPDGRLHQRRWVTWVVAAGCGALMIAAVLALLLRRALPSPKVLGSVQITNDGRPKLGIIVTDGSRIYFIETLGGGFALAQVSASGGETAFIPTSLQLPTILDMSPAHSEILVANPLYRGESQLTVVPVPSGSPHPLGNVIAHDGTWSPNGERIVYAIDRDLYSARTDGSEPHKLVSASGVVMWPRWSPDGKTLRFTVLDAEGRSLWEVRRDGTNLRPLLPGFNDPSNECCGTWTPDGKYFLFQSAHKGRTDVWSISERSQSETSPRQPVQLTSGPMDIGTPLPSTDGKKLFVTGATLRGELTRYDSKSGQFSQYLSGISAEGVDFSRDGKWIAYVTYPEGTLWRSNVDGGDRRQLTYPPMEAALPSWSPDGKRIAFTANQPRRPPKIYTVSAEGGTPQLAMSGDQGENDASWSPNGNSLAFGVAWPDHKMAIQVLDVQTRRITTLPGSEGLFAPRWSPDGRYIVARPFDGQRLLLFDMNNKKWTELVRLPPGYYNWSRDGRFVYFDVQSANEPEIYRVRVTDRKVEHVVRLKDFRRATGIYGSWMGLAPDNSPLLLHNVGVQEIYALDWEAP